MLAGITARSAFFDATGSPSTDTATHDRSFIEGMNPSIAVRNVSTDSDRETMVDSRLIVNIGDVNMLDAGAVVAGAWGAGDDSTIRASAHRYVPNRASAGRTTTTARTISGPGPRPLRPTRCVHGVLDRLNAASRTRWPSARAARSPLG